MPQPLSYLVAGYQGAAVANIRGPPTHTCARPCRRELLNPQRELVIGGLRILGAHIRRLNLPGFKSSDFDYKDKQNYEATCR